MGQPAANIWEHSPLTDTCPTWPTLLAWLENDLPEEESQLLNTHVADCDERREKLALMNAVQDVGDVGRQLASQSPDD